MRGITRFRAKINQVKPSLVFLVLAVLVGGYLRLTKGLSSDFPLNDGGLFYQMTQELIENHFRLPVFTSYNHLNIPYAYPPLAFYLTGVLNQIFGWSLLSIYRIFPAVVTVLTIPAFYLLARDFTEDDNHLSLAVLIFALIPVTFDWTIMGGGVTRALAFLFSLLSLHYFYRLFKTGVLLYLFPSAIFLSLAILSHPETGFHAAVSVPVFWFFLSRSKKGLLHAGLIVILTLLLTAPWWGSVVARHGFTPFFSALSTAEQNGNAFFDLVNLEITDELGTASIAIFSLIGAFFYLAKKKYFIPVWILVSFAAAPRSARIFIAPSIAILAGFSLLLLIQWLDSKKVFTANESESTSFMTSILSKILLAIMFFQWFSSAAKVLKPFSTIRMSWCDRAAFIWIKSFTPEESRFAILTNYFWSGDPVSEWFPTLTDRISIGTVQGTEWLGGGRFLEAVKGARELQDCNDQTPECIENWSLEYQKDFDYLYLRQLKIKDSSELVPYQSALAELLKDDPSYSLVFESDSVAIFKKK